MGCNVHTVAPFVMRPTVPTAADVTRPRSKWNCSSLLLMFSIASPRHLRRHKLVRQEKFARYSIDWRSVMQLVNVLTGFMSTNKQKYVQLFRQRFLNALWLQCSLWAKDCWTMIRCFASCSTSWYLSTIFCGFVSALQKNWPRIKTVRLFMFSTAYMLQH